MRNDALLFCKYISSLYTSDPSVRPFAPTGEPSWLASHAPAVLSFYHHVQGAREDDAEYDETRDADGHAAHEQRVTLNKLLHALVATLIVGVLSARLPTLARLLDGIVLLTPTATLRHHGPTLGPKMDVLLFPQLVAARRPHCDAATLELPRVLSVGVGNKFDG